MMRIKVVRPLVRIAVLLILVGLFGARRVAATDAALDGYVAVPQVSPGVGEYLITPDQRLILDVYFGRIQVIDLKTGTKMRTLGSDKFRFSSYGVSSDSTMVYARLEADDDEGSAKTEGKLVAWRLVDGARIARPGPPPVMHAPPDWREWRKQHPRTTAGLDPRYGIEPLPDDREADGSRYALVDFKTGERRTFVLAAGTLCEDGPETFAYDGTNLVLARGGGEGGVTMLTSSLFAWDGATFRRKWISCQEGKRDLGEWVAGATYATSLCPDAPIKLWSLDTERVFATISDIVAGGPVALSQDGLTLVAETRKAGKSQLTVFRNGVTFTMPADIPSGREDDATISLSPHGRFMLVRRGDAYRTYRLSGSSGVHVASVRIKLENDRDVKIEDDGLLLVVEHDPNDRDGAARHGIVIAPDEEGFIQSFPDGCVHASAKARRYVKLVKGFDIHDWDDAAVARLCRDHPVRAVRAP